MIHIDRKTGKVWIEATISDEHSACHHALFELSEDLKKLIREMHAVASEAEDKLDYASKYVFIGVEFFEDEDSEGPMGTEGTTLHVSHCDFWFSAWCKYSYLRVETFPILVMDAFNHPTGSQQSKQDPSQ